MTQGSIHQKDTIFLSPYPRSSKCMKQKLTEQKGEIDKSTDCYNKYKEIQQTSTKVSTNLILLIFMEHSTQQHQNAPTFQVHMEHLTRSTICKKIILLKVLKSWGVCSLTTVKLHQKSYFQTYVWKTLKYLEIKQHSSLQFMGQKVITKYTRKIYCTE